MKLSLSPPPMWIICSALLLHGPAPIVALTQFEHPGHAISSSQTRTVISHPSTGSCVLRMPQSRLLKLGPCNQSDPWRYTPQKFLLVEGTYFCLQGVGSGKAARLGNICSESDSKWEVISKSEKHYLSTELSDSSSVCLDVDADNNVITNPCACMSNGGACNSDSQWFVITTQNENLDTENAILPSMSLAYLP